MPFDPHLAAIRFGTGLSPRHAPPASADAMLARLAGPDDAAAAFPIPGFAAAEPSQRDYNLGARAVRDAATEAERTRAQEAQEARREVALAARARNLTATVARLAAAEDGLRERLALFWADHFTVEAKNNFGYHQVSSFAEDAIRPHLAGRFAEMLFAALTHPMMLTYLDQAQSFGPTSEAGLRGGRGLNENLAREALELHTVGAGGPYGQQDVRELAELLTGLGTDGDGATTFRAPRAEPGAETVLGTIYPDAASLDTVRAAAEGLATHPVTARHLSRKLAVHFVADDPPPGLVDLLAATWGATGGDLLAVTGTLLAHPDAWGRERLKVKPPLDWLGSALRALGLDPGVVTAMDLREARRTLLNPLAVMGQPWQEPGGPDGWPEEARAWVTPQAVAGRIDWAMNRPEEMMPDLPDPRDLVAAALGPHASEAVAFAARAAERLSEGVGCVLASADFQRR